MIGFVGWGEEAEVEVEMAAVVDWYSGVGLASGGGYRSAAFGLLGRQG